MQHVQGDYSSAFQSAEHTLDIRLKFLGEEHSSTADSSIHQAPREKHWTTFPQLFRLNSILLISDLNCLEKNVQVQLIAHSLNSTQNALG